MRAALRVVKLFARFVRTSTRFAKPSTRVVKLSTRVVKASTRPVKPSTSLAKPLTGLVKGLTRPKFCQNGLSNIMFSNRLRKMAAILSRVAPELLQLVRFNVPRSANQAARLRRAARLLQEPA